MEKITDVVMLSVLGIAQQEVIGYNYIYTFKYIYTHCIGYFLTLRAVTELVNSGLLQMEINFFKINSNFACSESFQFKITENSKQLKIWDTNCHSMDLRKWGPEVLMKEQRAKRKMEQEQWTHSRGERLRGGSFCCMDIRNGHRSECEWKRSIHARNTDWNQSKEKEVNSDFQEWLIFQGARVVPLKIPLKDKEEEGLWGAILKYGFCSVGSFLNFCSPAFNGMGEKWPHFCNGNWYWWNQFSIIGTESFL